MKLSRRKLLHLAAGAAALPAASHEARAQTYPSRPITMIVPYAAGGPNDSIGRLLAERMKEPLGEPIIIENVSGADGSIGVGRAARATPDGYTIHLGSIGTHVFNSAFYSLQYDVLNDFTPISALLAIPVGLFARKAMPARDLTELIAWLKVNHNKASVGTATSSLQVITALFQKETATQLVRVPYRDALTLLQDTVAGRIDLYFASAEFSLSQLRAGNIKAYAVTNDTRLTLAPEIPTFAELGLPALSFFVWIGLFAPKGTPQDIIDKLNAAVMDALADPAVRSRLADLGSEIFPRERQTPEALRAMQHADAEKWWPIIKALGIKRE